MEHQLFVCEYGYILYKVLIRALLDPKTKERDDLIITDASQDLRPMYEIIKKANLFRHVYFFDCTPYRNYYRLLYCEYPQNSIKKHLFVLSNYLKMSFAQYKFKKIKLGFSIDFRAYSKIYCSDHPYVINGYLASHKIPYTIIEHARNVYRNLTKPYDLFFVVLSVLDKFHIMRGLRCTSRYCEAVEINEKGGLAACLNHKHLLVWDVEEKLKALTEDQRDLIYQIYANAYGLSLDYNKTYNVLLTNQLYSKAFVPSEEMQIKFYRDTIEKYLNDATVLIKPHPKDTVNYKVHFPDCIVVDNDISSEVLNFSKELKINRALTLYSTSGNSFRKKAKEVIILEKTEDPTQMDSLRPYR